LIGRTTKRTDSVLVSCSYFSLTVGRVVGSSNSSQYGTEDFLRSALRTRGRVLNILHEAR